MNQKNYLSSVIVAAFAMAIAIPITGCQSQTNPWAGKPYQDPVTYRSPPQSIYAPMPSILPSIEGTAMETDASLEAELDLLIDDN